MNIPRDLALYVVPPGHGASFVALNHGGLVVLRPLSEDAMRWLWENCGEEASWDGDRLFIESRYFPALVDGIIEAGFLFEGDGDMRAH